jgi:hypothetical protein
MTIGTIQTPQGEQCVETACSPNGQFTLAWCEPDASETTGERRKKGSFWLFRGESVLCSGHLDRPTAGAVADNGAFIVVDLVPTDDLASSLIAFGPAGDLLIRKRFKANINTSAIAPDGAYAICHTCNNPDSRHGNLLTLFDLRKKMEAWHLQPPFWPRSYSFDAARGEVSILMGADLPSSIYRSCVLALEPAKQDS